MKKMFKNIVPLFVAGLFTIPQVYAQHQITGRIIQEENESPLEFAHITVHTDDSVFVAGTASGLKGLFQIKNLPSGNYRVTASYAGYVPQIIALNGLIRSVDMGDIYLGTESHELEAVTVAASNVVHKADRLIIFVTEQQKANASNGINLLNALQLPRLTVNPLMNEVSLAGEGNVQFCINGVKVENADIRAIQPGEVVRIEYLDNPGVRYAGADVVINYLLKRETAGGSIHLDLGNALTTGFSNDQAAVKFNCKKSEFGLNYSLRYRKPAKAWVDEEQTFYLADGSSLKRFDKGLHGDLAENYHHLNLNYNLFEDGKYYLNATVRYAFLKDKKMRYTSRYTSINREEITNVHNGSNSTQQLPSVDLYYMRSLKNRQNLMVNVVGTHIHSQIDQMYEEKKAEQTVADIISDVEGDKYSIIGEAIYEKTFENNSRFTAGFKHTQAFAHNDYTGTLHNRTKMDQADSYLYAEYAGKKGKFSYITGAGLSRSRAKQREEDDYTYYTFRPKLTLQYDFSQSMFIRLRGEIYNTSPSLSNLSAGGQYIDTLQVMRGNPALKPHANYDLNLLFNWKKGIYGVNFYNTFQYSPDPIMEQTVRENNKFIRTWANHKNYQKLNSELTLSAGPLKKILMLSLTGGIYHYISEGNTYHHTYTGLYYRIQAMAMYKKFTAVVQANSAYDRLNGETLTGGENIHMCMINYNAGKFTAGAGIMMPFSDQYKRYGENRNIYAPKQMYMYVGDFSRMVLLQFAWNFNYGRKVKSGSKRLNNEDTDAGIMRIN
ncbi:MAG: outer membrane beta-barrel protein [Tannerella sp.]|jgi:hypothetical protein|nr:outer membrane beta-barrel protein [Tannerella sp.]